MSLLEAFAHNRAFLQDINASLSAFQCKTDRELYDLVATHQVRTFQVDLELEGSVEVGRLTREIAFALLGDNRKARPARPITLIDLEGLGGGGGGVRLVSWTEKARPPGVGWILDPKDAPRRPPPGTAGFYLKGEKRLPEAKRIQDVLESPIALLAPKALRVLQRGNLFKSKLVVLTVRLPSPPNWSFMARRARELEQQIHICPVVAPSMRVDRVESYRRVLDSMGVGEEFWQAPSTPPNFSDRIDGPLWGGAPPPEEVEVEAQPLPAKPRVARAPPKAWSEDRRRRFMDLRKLTRERQD